MNTDGFVARRADNDRSLIEAMAKQCRRVIQASEGRPSSLPEQLRGRHLLWMCDQIESRAHEDDLARLNRWVGFVQAGLLANDMLSLEELRELFNEANDQHSDVADLLDHLDPTSSFGFDIGGQG
jgi:hypothetical protein